MLPPVTTMNLHLFRSISESELNEKFMISKNMIMKGKLLESHYYNSFRNFACSDSPWTGDRKSCTHEFYDEGTGSAGETGLGYPEPDINN